jgi:hypothetical protein
MKLAWTTLDQDQTLGGNFFPRPSFFENHEFFGSLSNGIRQQSFHEEEILPPGGDSIF